MHGEVSSSCFQSVGVGAERSVPEVQRLLEHVRCGNQSHFLAEFHYVVLSASEDIHIVNSLHCENCSATRTNVLSCRSDSVLLL